MSSIPIPYDGPTSSPESGQTDTLSNLPSDPIPSYAEATTASPTLPNPQSILSPPPIDDPLAYALLDSSQTTFFIYGTFIHTAAGPAYQLSTPLDQRGSYFRIRRLRAREVQQVGSKPIAFDKSYILYEAVDLPLLDNEYHIQGKRRTCLPGVLEMKFRLHKWRVTHIPRPGAKGQEILSCKKVGAFGSTKLNRRRDLEGSEWKDNRGKVLAKEKLQNAEDGSVVPTVELSQDLDQTWRELLLTLWTTRLWIAFGDEKTAIIGGRFPKPSGSLGLLGAASARFR